MRELAATLKVLTDDHEAKLETLKDSTVWMKRNLIIYSIKQQQDKLFAKTKLRNQEKFGSLVINKPINEGIHAFFRSSTFISNTRLQLPKI